MRIMMIVASGLSYLVNEAIAKARYGNADKMNFEAPLTQLVWLTSLVSVAMTFIVSYLLMPQPGRRRRQRQPVVEAVAHHHLRHAGRRDHPRDGQGLHVDQRPGTSRRSSRRRAKAARRSTSCPGLTAGNFSAYWMGIVIVALMGIAYGVSSLGLEEIMKAPAVFAFGLVAFGFLGMGPVTIAVDSYGPVTDNAQSVYELSVIETIPGIKEEIKKTEGFDVNFEHAKHLLEENDGAGNTFKATAKPVLIGTAVVGATTMIFSIIMILTQGLTMDLDKLSLLHPPFLLGLIIGGAVIYWFTGASTQAVTTGAYRAVEFIKRNIKLEAARPRRRSPTARRSSRSARSTPRRACSTSSWRCSSARWRSPSSSRSSSSAT